MVSPLLPLVSCSLVLWVCNLVAPTLTRGVGCHKKSRGLLSLPRSPFTSPFHQQPPTSRYSPATSWAARATASLPTLQRLHPPPPEAAAPSHQQPRRPPTSRVAAFPPEAAAQPAA